MEAEDKKKEPNLDDDGEQISRRRFLNLVGNSAMSVAALGSLGVTFEYLKPNVLLEIPARFKASSLDSMPPNTVIFNADYRVFIFRDEKGYFYAVSAVCTHLGCTAQWKPDGIPGFPQSVIACPCHGSVFSRTGRLLRGPAPRHLDRFRMTLEDGKLVVDTSETVSEEEMVLKV